MPISKSRILSLLLGLLMLAIAIFAGYTWFSLNWSYSKGERTGYVQKFSHKGWLCKTWEGELTMLPVQGMVPEKFVFSVRSDVVAENITKNMAKKMALVYEQHKGVPTQCFGESEYFVTSVKVME
ncbi:hypothetical protein KI809_11320 [Geobacter pelophilus]|uniref:6-phosphogluconate dehydrogenase n=1 Tax=Geoanaerobacter pelophilus TaxID=60036 RepID=A0AAW4L1P1_9BACT|nr:hypothetical protein [Geoanaerobacter pelophilus]MBT0664891.1 hypothetical protein [Geoanaerobacter pelophilus]